MTKEFEQDRFIWEQDETDRNLLWERYKILSSETIDYLRIVINFTIFFYGITGAIISFVLSHENYEALKVAFWMPALMGISSSLAYFYFCLNQKITNEELENLADKLFGYTKREIRISDYLNTQAPYSTMSDDERNKIYKEEYGIDGSYMFRTTHALQATLLVLGLMHIAIGLFSLWLLFCYQVKS